MLVATLAAFVTPFMGSSINIALPLIGKEFAMDAITLGWISTSYLLAVSIFLVPFGRIADIYGRKRIFTWGIIVYTISSLLTGLSTSANLLIAFRILQGISGAMSFGTVVAILTSVFPPGERGRALGINVASVYSGLSLGPVLGGVIVEHLGWRSIFFINVAMGIVIIVVTLAKLRGEWAEARGEKFDYIGSIVYGVALAALILGFSSLREGIGLWLVAVGVALLIAFIRVESRMKSPVLNVSMFRHNTVFTLSNAAALINYMATSASGFLLSLYLQYVKGFNPEHAGLVLVVQPVIMALLSPIAGKLSDRVEARVVASSGMALSTISLAMLIFLTANMSLTYVIASLAIGGFGFGLFSSPNTNAVMSAVQKRFYGVASGILSTMRATGQMLSMGIALLLFSVYMGHTQITPQNFTQFLQSARTAFIIFSLLCLGGTFASLARGSSIHVDEPRQ